MAEIFCRSGCGYLKGAEVVKHFKEFGLSHETVDVGEHTQSMIKKGYLQD